MKKKRIKKLVKVMTSLFIDKLDRFWIRLSLFTNIPVPNQSHFQEMLYNVIDLS